MTLALRSAEEDRRSSEHLRHIEREPGVSTIVVRNWTFVVLWVFVLTIPWEAAVEELASIGTLSRTVGLLAVPLCLVSVLVDGRRHRLVDTHIIMVILATWTVVSTAWSISVGTTLQAASTMIQLLVMVVVLWEFCADDQRRSHLQWAFVLGAMIGSVAIFQAALTQDEVTTRYIRVTEGGLNENYAAFVLSIAIPVAWHLSLTSTKALHRWVAALYIPVGIVAVVLTGSRGGLFTLFLALSFLPMTLRRGGLRSKAFALVLLAISVFVVAKFVPPQTIDRLETIPAELTTGDLSAREQAWEASWAIFASNPIVGVGAGASRLRIEPTVGREQGPHNTYLSLAADLGAVGLGLFLLLLLSVAVRGFRLRGQKRRLVNVLLVTLLIGLLPGHWEYHKATWLIVALMLAETASTQAAGRVALASKQQSHPLPDKLFVAAANPASTYGKDPNSS